MANNQLTLKNYLTALKNTIINTSPSPYEKYTIVAHRNDDIYLCLVSKQSVLEEAIFDSHDSFKSESSITSEISILLKTKNKKETQIIFRRGIGVKQ
mgnify:CR=1 FL=1